MVVLAAVAAVALGLTIAVDAFESIVLPRRVASRFRLTRIFYIATWTPWRFVAARIRDRKAREGFLSVYGPLSILLLLVVWAAGGITAFALAHWAAAGGTESFAQMMFISGVNFVTLGEGAQHNDMTRALTVIEAVSGFGLLAIVIGYLPVLYQSFSRREANITLLDARAGSPPSAAELLRKYGQGEGVALLPEMLRDWERWAAELLESHISYPVLSYFRSQHDNQSWLGALTSVLDASALCLAGVEGVSSFQAQLTFAMARHAMVDLAKIFNVPPCPECVNRLPGDTLPRLRARLAEAGVRLRDGEAFEQRLAELRRMYEPYVDALSRFLLMELPPWISEKKTANWQTSKWERSLH